MPSQSELKMTRVPHARGDGPRGASRARSGRARSPRTWGWTVPHRINQTRPCAFPTHVGMDRQQHRAVRARCRVPHARGDGPRRGPSWPTRSTRSPRTWGWTEDRADQRRARGAFPTHVGMDRRPGAQLGGELRVPHARGDGPASEAARERVKKRSPRTWGWTVLDSEPLYTAVAFPTHVGMDRYRYVSFVFRQRVPHARGDGPMRKPLAAPSGRRSPRTWGWTGGH